MPSASRPRTTRRSSSSSTIRPATSSISPPCGAPRPTRRSGSPARTPPRRATTSARAPSSSRAGTHQSEIVLEPNPNWYGDVKPTLTEIRYHIGGDPAAAQAAFEAGEYDIAQGPAGQVPRIMDDPELGPLTQAVPSVVFDYWGFDTAKGPTANRSLAARACHGDRQGHAARDRLRRPGPRRRQPDPARHPGSPGGHRPSSTTSRPPRPNSPPLSRSSGYTDVSEIPPLSFGFNTDAGHDVPAAFMQEQWRTNLGVESELKGVTFDQFVEERPKARLLDRPERLGPGLSAPGQRAPRPVPQPEWQQRRGRTTTPNTTS